MLRRWQPNPPVSLNSSARKACGVRAQTPEALAVGCRGRSSLRSARGPLLPEIGMCRPDGIEGRQPGGRVVNIPDE